MDIILRGVYDLSVINQMLKDLDQRHEGSREQASVNPAYQQTPISSKRNFVVALVVIILLNALGWFVWQMYQENETLKKEKQVLSNEVALATQAATSSLPESKQTTETSTGESPVEEPIKNAKKVAKTTDDEVAINNEPLPEQSVVNTAKSKAQEEIASTKTDKPSEKTETKSVEPEVVAVAKENEPVKPSISIKRRQLTAEELAEKNYKQAQQSLNAGDIKNAEKWFEEVLMLTPNNSQARKELAALWFGRQDYSAAHSLLSQGLAREPSNSEFRLMKARIFIKQNRLQQALTTLTELKDVTDVEYQSLLASTAQQLEAYESAIYAYQKLTELEQNNGKWWLGLAIGLDKQSDFTQAVEAYKHAIDSHSLSENAIKFAQSRVSALGE